MDNSDLPEYLLAATTLNLGPATAVFMSDGGRNQFSGVLCRCDSGHFALTAQHCIRDPSSIVMATVRNQVPGIRLSSAAARVHASLDLAVIPLPASVAQLTRADWIERSAINGELARPGTQACLFGYPFQFLEIVGDSPRSASPTPHLLTTEVSDRWPNSVLQYAASPEVDSFVDWNRLVRSASGGEATATEYSPVGMSGCGVFIVPRPSGNRLWSAGEAQLAGILISYIDSERLIRCVRAENVLGLIDQAAAGSSENGGFA